MAKPLPSSIETEQSLVGCLLIDEEIIEPWMSSGGAMEHFYNTETKLIAKHIFKRKLAGESVDLVTVKEGIEEEGKLEKIGGMSYLVELIDSTPTSSNWATYANDLKDLYKRRELIREARRLEQTGYGGENVDEAILKTFDNITNILKEGESKATDTEDNILLIEKHIEENKSKDLIGYSWGLDWLDQYTGGIRKGKTYRIGAPSGVGKTNLVYQTIDSLLKQDCKVLFISLENSIETTYIKLLSTIQEVNPNKLEKGEVKAKTEWIRENKDKFFLTDQLFNLADIKREVLKVKPDVVILDYLGLVNIKGYDEKTMYNQYADEVKQFVQKHQELAWIDLSNLNKDDDEERIRSHKGFNGSAKLRNNVDVGIHMFYYKPFYEYKEHVNDVGTEEAKNGFRGKQVITFLLSKNRLGYDGEEAQMLIDFDKGIRYKQATDDQKKKWKDGI